MPAEFPFNAPSKQFPNLPFPPSVSRDPDVLYHGTSSANEEKIEKDGLCSTASLFELSELKAIAALFHSIRWSGSSGASLAVLEPFSIQHDRACLGSKPTFFAESGHRACLYASNDYAGGEVARAVRYCLRELWSYVRDEEVRERHRAVVQRQIDAALHLGAAVPALPPADISHLADGLHTLRDVQLRAEGAIEEFRYGVVYAIKFEPSDFPSLEAHSSMGVKCRKAVPRESIIAKVRVPKAYIHNSFLMYDYFALPSIQGIVATLRSR